MADATLWTGGRVFTGRRYAESILVENGRVVFAGGSREAHRLAPTGTEHRSLGGRLLIPGLVDAHLHVSDLTRVREGFALSSTRSFADLRERLTAWAVDHPLGPIVGRGWDPERWSDRRWPSAREIDPVVSDRPVILHHASGHAALLNSAALEAVEALEHGALGASKTVGRFPDGTPNGLLFEEAVRLAESAVSGRAGPGDEALERTLHALTSYGLTSVAAMSASLEEVRSLRTLDTSDRLPLTVRAFVRLDELSGLSRADLGAGGARFAVVGVKAYLDGAFGTRTASLREPYSDDASTSGIRVGSDRQLAERLDEADERGLVPALHAIGDDAVARATNLLRSRRSRPNGSGRIEHAALTPPGVLGPLLEVRPTLVVQPGFVWSDSWLSNRLGPARRRWAYVFRTLVERGLPVAGSSDAPYDPVDPWRGIAAATARRDARGGSANPDPREALSPEEALGLYTAHAAASVGLAPCGRLEPDAPADMVVLTTSDLYRAVRSTTTPVRETWVGGHRVFGDAGSPGQ